MKTAIQIGVPSGVMFGAIWVLVMSPGLIFLGVMGYVLLALALAAFLFVITAFPFGFAMGFFGEYQQRRFLAMKLVPDDESLLYQGGANHFVGFEGVGGWLYLTDKMLRFKSHELNFQPHELAIPLSDITKIDPTRMAGIFPNGVLVNTKEGQPERFVVSGPSFWISAITKAKMQAAS
ncbi:hypothetical protein C5Y96_10865 [Blastopirellula marina]|uniref:GRAM domain-containing protein n=1 Tax=Blastopirellula marina TaxID=124 RepID=A0A2S8FME9_9BACT|nr:MULTISPECIES: GRAM domain-containing protein [Pirellulaceae]PQO33345.1 hypothetical protein C5Y96_10865 [Blastopirellula marina]RCS52434.1 hypothetical protein DTL36_10875 [Bremerella cremea]